MWILVIVLASAFWVLIDASNMGVKKGQLTGIANLSPLGWFFACLGLWIIAFPLYLSKRPELKRLNGK